MKRILCSFFSVLLIFFGINTQVDFAKIFNAGTEDEFEVTAIEYTREHVGFDTTSGYVEIRGSGLQGKEILFRTDDIGGGTVAMGEKTLELDGLIKYVFTPEEATKFNGEIVISGQIEDIGLDGFPNVDSVDKKNVNIDLSEDLILNGSNFDNINGTTIVAEYGTAQKNPISYDAVSGDTPKQLTIEDIDAPAEKGFQNIVIDKEDLLGDIIINVRHTYTNAFRLVENLNLTDLIMYPNTVGKGDEIYFDSENFLGSSIYEAYLIETGSQTEDFSEANKCVTQSLEGDILTVTAPTGEAFEFGDYNVILTRKLNDQIVAIETVKDTLGDPEVLTVVDADFQPTITEIYPSSGPDIGSDVQIKGNNLISLNIPDLVVNDPEDLTVTNPDGNNQDLQFIYNAGGTYKENNVSIQRIISVQIAGKVTFQIDDGNYKYTKGVPDSLYVTTPSVNDADTDPYRDVVIEISTVLDDGINTYTFNQRVTKKDGYEYIPSSIEPTINSITPSIVQVEGTNNNFKESLQMSISGENFLVNTYTNQVETFLNSPQILIKTTNNLDENDYDLKIDPNATVDGITGVIYYQGGTVLRDPDTNVPIPLEYEVLNDDLVVDGTTNNEIGNQIIFKVPNIAQVSSLGKKNIQVVNPKRFTQFVGESAIALDIIEFIKTVDVPVIESVEPSVVSVEGGVTVEVIGNNFKEGIKVFLDNKEINGINREIDNTGTKVILSFVAPANRQGPTQLQVLNPSGGIDVADFFYIDSFEKDPTIIDFSPKLGTEETLVAIDGDNFLKPDPTGDSDTGVDALRLLGTRVYLDGKDVNEYNKYQDGSIKFVNYESPNSEALYTLNADSIELSKFVDNVFGKRVSDNSIFQARLNAFDNLVLYSNSEEYVLEYDAVNDTMIVVDGSGESITYDELDATPDYDPVTGITSISIGGEIYNFQMNNDLLSIIEDPDGVKIVDLANYADDIILRDSDNDTYYRIYEDVNGDIVLTNGKEGVYTIVTNTLGDELIAKNDSSNYEITINDPKTSISVDVGSGIQLDFITPYLYSTLDNRYIYGRRAKVINRNQIVFTVPGLSTGKGFKDLAVVNPDTRRAERLGTEGFYYIQQSSTNPAISKITPNIGSIDGGYFIKIDGKDFEENTAVYIDGYEVSSEDVTINLDGTQAIVKVPPYQKNLAQDFGVDSLSVPVVVINPDGGSDYRLKGFTYIVPISSPEIEEIVPSQGTSNGGTIVEIFGQEFRYFEPYINKVGGPEYDLGDEWQELFINGEWDNLLDPNVDENAVIDEAFNESVFYEYFKKSPILPKVYFGNNEAKIVEYANGYLKVITPENTSDLAQVDVTVVNNDYGISNPVPFSYENSQPSIDQITPPHGAMSGVEKRDFYGDDFYKREDLEGYKDDDASEIRSLDNLDSLVKFADVSNEAYERTAPNSGLVNGLRADVNLDGGFKIIYNGNDTGADPNTLKVFLEANGEIYKRTFENYDDRDILIPMEMLKFDNDTPNDSSDDLYYESYRYDDEVNSDTYRNLIFEYVRVRIKDRRLIVDRFIAPKVTYESRQRMTVTTASYYKIGDVNVEVTNADGGTVTGDFTYTNPASEPKIYEVKPYVEDDATNERHVKGTINGGIQLEIIGEDLREDITVYIGAKEVNVIEQVKKSVVIDGSNVEFDDIIIEVPAGVQADIGEKYPIIVENTDFGIANSSQIEDLYGSQSAPYYFIYQVPLSGPIINEVIPEKTSVYGGNTVTLKGQDFRAGATVIIGSRGGVPVEIEKVTDRGETAIFETPRNLTVGVKDLQIINEDFGTFNKPQSIEIISYPIIDNISTAAGNAVDWISIEGGEEIRFEGSDFYNGAEVYFGTRWSEKTNDALEGASGLFRNDKIFLIENPIPAANVEVVDNETLLVTTPQLTREGDYTIVIINEDTGISNGDLVLPGKVPLPSNPVNLKAEVIDDRYIRIFDYTADSVDYYEIYFYQGKNSKTRLINNDYRDFTYIDTTEIEPYRISSLPGVENIQPDETVSLVLKAVNKYGPSSWSNIVTIEYEDLEDVEEIGPPDADGDLGVPEGQNYDYDATSEAATINITDKAIDPTVVIELSDLEDLQKKLINVPGDKVRSNTSLIGINFGDTQIQFTPISLNTQEFRNIDFYNDSYGRIANEWIDNDYSSVLKSYLPRGKQPISKVYSLDFYALNNSEDVRIQRLNADINFSLRYNPDYLTSGQNVGLFRFDGSRSWVQVNAMHNESRNTLTTAARTAGKYIILKY